MTLQDLADRAKISRSAASKAIRDHPRISQAKREEVQRLAAELNYVPDPALSRLAHDRWSGTRSGEFGTRVAYVLPFSRSHGHDETLRANCRQSLEDSGYGMDAFYTPEQSPERLADILRARGIRGVLFPKIFEAEPIGELARRGFVCVAVSEGSLLPPCELIRPDYLWALSDAIRRLREAGCQKLSLHVRKEDSGTPLLEHMEAIWLYQGLDRDAIKTLPEAQSCRGWLKHYFEGSEVDGVITLSAEPYVAYLRRGSPPRYLPRLISLVLNQPHVNRMDGYLLHHERVAQRAVDFLHAHLSRSHVDAGYGTTLLRPEWHQA